MRKDYRSLVSKAGQKIQLKADIYPLPGCDFHYKWEITKGKNIASVDENGVLTVSSKAVAGDKFTVKISAVVADPYLTPKPSIVTYLVQ